MASLCVLVLDACVHACMQRCAPTTTTRSSASRFGTEQGSTSLSQRQRRLPRSCGRRRCRGKQNGGLLASTKQIWRVFIYSKSKKKIATPASTLTMEKGSLVWNSTAWSLREEWSGAPGIRMSKQGEAVRNLSGGDQGG